MVLPSSLGKLMGDETLVINVGDHNVIIWGK